MPRKQKAPAKPRKKAAPKKNASVITQSGGHGQAAVVVNVGTVAKRRAPARRRAPRQTIEEAEYIAALNRTIPSVQINPPPASQGGLLSQDQAVGLLQSVLSLKPSGEKSIAQRDVERRDAAAHMQQTNTLLEHSLADIVRRPEVDISPFNFTRTPDLISRAEPPAPRDTIPLVQSASPANDMLSASRPISGLDSPLRDTNTLSLIHPDLLESSPEASPIDRPDKVFEFHRNVLPGEGDFTPGAKQRAITQKQKQAYIEARKAEGLTKYEAEKEWKKKTVQPNLIDTQSAFGKTAKALATSSAHPLMFSAIPREPQSNITLGDLRQKKAADDEASQIRNPVVNF